MKKVLSLVLSLCLIVSLGAGISFDTASAAAADLYWNFMKTNNGTTGDAYLQSTTNLSYDTTTAGSASEVKPEIASEPYQYFGYTETNAGGYAMYASAGYGILMFTPARGQTGTLALKLKVNKAGTYVPMLNIHGFTDYALATTYEFYLIKANGTETSIADIDLSAAVAKKVFNFGAYGTYDEYQPLCDTPVSVTAGEYFLVARSHQGGKGSFCFDGFKLVEAGNAPALTPIRLNVGHDERLYTVKVGEKIKIPFDLDNAAGGKVDLALTNGWSDSGDTDCVGWRIAKETSTLDFTGLAVTDGVERHWVKYGETVAAYFNIKVVANEEAPDKDLYYDWFKAFSEATTFGGDSDYPETVTMGMTTVGSLTEINRWKGTNNHNPDTVSSSPVSIYSDPIGFYQMDATATAAMTYHNFGMWHGGTGNFDLIFKVTEDGYYLPKVILTRESKETVYTAGSAHTISIMSLDGTTTYGSVAVAKGQGAPATFANQIALKKGDYILRFNQTAAGTNFFDALSLEYKGGLTYNVALDAGEGTVATPLTSYTHGTAVTLPAATKEGYTFDGWFDANDNKVTEIAANARGDKAYTAKYTYVPKTYNVTLNANGGTLASELTSYTEGEGATLPTATKGIATFGGWYDNADFIGDAVTAIGTDATGDKEFWAKWTVEIPETAEITVTSDSGYYSEKFDSADKEGVIAVSTYFSMFADIKAEVSKVGVMIYVEGNEAVEAKIARVETTDAAKIAEITDTFNALFTAIAEANFGKAVIAKPYLVVSGEYVYGDAVELEGVNAAKWLGPKA